MLILSSLGIGIIAGILLSMLAVMVGKKSEYQINRPVQSKKKAEIITNINPIDKFIHEQL